MYLTQLGLLTGKKCGSSWLIVAHRRLKKSMFIENLLYSTTIWVIVDLHGINSTSSIYHRYQILIWGSSWVIVGHRVFYKYPSVSTHVFYCDRITTQLFVTAIALWPVIAENCDATTRNCDAIGKKQTTWVENICRNGSKVRTACVQIYHVYLTLHHNTNRRFYLERYSR